VLVDAFQQVPEIDEDNNRIGPLRVDTAGPADLSISAFDTFEDIDGVWYYIEVENTGEAPALNVDVDLFFDLSATPATSTQEDNFITFDEVAPGGIAWVEFWAEGGCSYGCLSYAEVDRFNLVVENNESNNVEGPMWVLY
jgi:hypothetical protein